MHGRAYSITCRQHTYNNIIHNILYDRRTNRNFTSSSFGEPQQFFSCVCNSSTKSWNTLSHIEFDHHEKWVKHGEFFYFRSLLSVIFDWVSWFGCGRFPFIGHISCCRVFVCRRNEAKNSNRKWPYVSAWIFVLLSQRPRCRATQQNLNVLMTNNTECTGHRNGLCSISYPCHTYLMY